MRKFKLKLFIVSLVVSVFHVYGQNSPEVINVSIHSPEANSLLNYIYNPVNYGRGTVDITIPLYEIPLDKNLTLPISLSYSVKDLDPNSQSKYLGLGWRLNAAPSIVREVRGMPDDNSSGTYYVAENENLFGNLSLENWYDRCKRHMAGGYDMEPDVYHYTLLNKSGSFMFKRETRVGNEINYRAITIPYEPIKISANGLYKHGNTSFQIIDENGFKYTFDKTERVADYYDAIWLYNHNDVVSAWKCSKIENSAGQVIAMFNYEDMEMIERKVYTDTYTIEDNPDYYQTSRDDSGSIPELPRASSYHHPRCYVQKWEYKDPNGNLLREEMGFQCTNNYKTLQSIYVFPKRLTSINLNGGSTIYFEGANGHLSTISGANRTIDLVNDSYSDPYLKSLCVDGLFYFFEYDDGSGGYDCFSGYCTSEHSYIEPRVYYKVGSYPVSNTYRYVHASLNLDRESAESGFGYKLKSMTNPTGCVTEFKYERNHYIKDKRQSAFDIYEYEYLKSHRIRASGNYRIRQIDYSDPNLNTRITRVFRYGDERKVGDSLYLHRNEPENGLGIIKRQEGFDSYVFQQKKYTLFQSGSVNSITRLRHINHPLNSMPAFPNNYVAYRRVTEYQVTTNSDGVVIDNGKTVYTYDYPEYSWESPIVSSSPNNNRHFFDQLTDHGYGQLLSKQIYKKENDTYQLISKSDYEYQVFGNNQDVLTAGKLYQEYVLDLNGHRPLRNEFSTTQAILGHNIWDMYKLVSYPIASGTRKLKSETDSIFENGSVLVHQKTYEYDNRTHLYPTKVTEINSDNTIFTKELKYSLDASTVTDQEHLNAKNMMVSKNILMPVLEEKISTNSTRGVSSTTNYNSYKIFNGNRPLPYVSKTLYNNGSVVDQITCNKYDNYGNFIEIVDKSGLKIIYIWGYSGRYLVAEIVNASYSTVMSALGNIPPETLSGSNTPNMSQINALRGKTSLNDAQITTYTHEPYVGITSITDPRGVKTTYSYDDFGRLQNIKDENGNIIESYDYHYRNQ